MFGKKKLSADEKFIHDTVSRVFKVSLVPSKDPSLYHLKDLANELSTFTETDVEAVLIERISKGFDHTSKTIFSFLMECFDRAEKELSLDKKKEDQIKFVKSIKEIIVSYCGIVLTDPDMFDQPESVCKQGPLLLAPYICGDIPGSFLSDLVARFADSPKTLDTIFTPIYSDMSGKLLKLTLIDDYAPYLLGFKRVTTLKELAIVLVNHPNFLPKRKNGNSF